MYFVKTPYLVKKIYSRNRIWDIKTDEKVIYLTFDDGPIPEITPWVLELLQKYNAKATFFMVGENVKKHQLLFDEVKSAGHTIGNHTYNHLNGWKTSTSDYVRNVELCNELVSSNLFRPPYGKIKPSQAFLLEKNYKIICWSILSGDFDPALSKEKCLEGVIKRINPGSILCFHDSVKASEKLKYVLPEVLSHFSDLDFKFNLIPSNVKPMIEYNREEKTSRN